jgi:uncharacterized protein (TIGR00251 family)
MLRLCEASACLPGLFTNLFMPPDAITAALSSTGDGIRLRVKVVPGASRTKIAGLLGDRLKIAVAAPPEGGKANRAVCELIAGALGVAMRDVAIVEGVSQPRKTVEVIGVTLCSAIEGVRDAMAQ